MGIDSNGGEVALDLGRGHPKSRGVDRADRDRKLQRVKPDASRSCHLGGSDSDAINKGTMAVIQNPDNAIV